MTNKYGNKRTVVYGIEFDSKAEANHYLKLRDRLERGEISDLKLQPKYELQAAFTDRHGTKHLAIHYIADFRYIERGQVVAVDVKGAETEVWRIKWKLAIRRYPSVIFRTVKA